MNNSSRLDRELQAELDSLRQNRLLRSLAPSPAAGGKFRDGSREILNFSSNDYLDLASDPRVIESARRAVERYGAGVGASRLMSGHLALHEELEARLARLTAQPAALAFGSGFLTNLGVIGAVCGRADAIFEDRLNHASLIDGARLCGAKLFRYRHNDLEHLLSLLKANTAFRRRLIVSDSIFSMDGDRASLRELETAARDHDCALMIDEAHAIGVAGPGGGGLCLAFDPPVRPDIVVGTLSKALGSYGGFAAGSAILREWLINRARGFIYSTGLPPACLGAAMGALEALEAEPRMAEELQRRAAEFRAELVQSAFDLGDSSTQILPILVGGNETALAFSRRLRQRDMIAIAVRPPTVPPGRARLRLSVTLAHEPNDLRRAARILREEAEALRAAPPENPSSIREEQRP
ncbi:MAG: 8-amino-7-oxononanoate synthase 2 [candidate division BRC1 bacterium ADurb.BinA364]|nr:MAG: 8-amino-7-oxononanoate synthase 2 [candidate division BRC1 bacterium ADurb.BinA364]